MRHPLKIRGRTSRLEGMHIHRDFELGAAMVDVIGKIPNSRPYVSICNARNEVIITIDATQMNGLVSRWMKANGWEHFRNDAGEIYQKTKPPSQRRKR